MSDKDRQKKDGERKDGDAAEGRAAVAERKAGQEPAQMPKDKSNHLIGDDEPLTKRDERL
ncbi:MAG: hypothetical protein LC785_02875 [Acidobacteria bacterium]|nr:hypothetical protein [Acidobacteriota bacterium]MCA1640929.1 hypothetical protein [Acidobacteriota bacterium]